MKQGSLGEMDSCGAPRCEWKKSFKVSKIGGSRRRERIIKKRVDGYGDEIKGRKC